MKNTHLLIINTHNSHVIIDVLQTRRRMGLDLNVLPSHMSHTLLTLSIYYFMSFKMNFHSSLEILGL